MATRHGRWPLANTDLTSRTVLISKILPVDNGDGWAVGRWLESRTDYQPDG